MERRARKLRGWRRFAVAVWRNPYDPQSYGDIELDASAMLAFIEEARRRTGVHVTVLHLVGKAVAHALTKHPELNFVPRRDRLIPLERVDVSFIVTITGGADSTTVTIEDAGRRSVVGIARELAERASRLRAGDPGLARGIRLSERLPQWSIRPLLRAIVWLTVDRGVDLGRFGLRAGLFGSVIVTSVGGMGIDHAYGNITPFSRTPLALMVGRVQDRAVVVDGEIVARPTATVSATLDHRYLDGSHAAKLAEGVREYCADPEAFEPT